MLKELFFKKASEKKDEENRVKKRYLFGAMGAGLVGQSLVGAPTLSALSRYTSSADDLADIESYRTKYNLQDIPMHYGKDAKTIGGYVPKGGRIPYGVHAKTVHAPMVVHELAHARQFRNHTTPKLVARALGGSVLAPTVASAATVNKIESPEWAAAVPLLASSPTLITEGHANLSSLRHMMSRHGFTKGLSKSKLLFPAMASYVLPPAALSATIYYLKKKQLENAQTPV